MNAMKYLDFDVAIEPAGDGFAARVFSSPAGQATATFTAPFSDLEIENFLLRVGRSRHAVRRIESPEMASAKAFGGRLFDQVFAGDVRGCLRSSIDEASRQGLGLRVRLHLTKVPALADLPWEFLYNASMNRFLSLSVETPLVRYLELPERIRPLTVQPPLHVLMMISSPTDYPTLDVARESEKMSEALADLEKRGLVVVERQEDATLAELQRRLRSGQYHIFHFIGHGGFDAQADDGILVMEDQENRGRRVSAQFLGTLLHDHRPLRLAVLNACEGGRASRGDPFAGTAQSLVQQGIPAVIAMQFEVTDEAAICFTREFYAAIAVGYPVDAALAEARKAIFAEVSEIEWGTPVLYMRSPDGRVFEIEQVSEAARKQLQLSSLLSAARTAATSGHAAAAIEKLEQILAIDAAHADATALLRELSREKELETLYDAARASYDAGRWREAIDRLTRVTAINRGYKDVQALVANAERELKKAEAEEQRTRDAAEAARAAAADAARQRAVPLQPTAETGPRRSVGWFFMGGALGAAVVIGLLVVAGVAIAIFMSNRQPDTPADDPKNPPAPVVNNNPPTPSPRVEPAVDPKRKVVPDEPKAVRAVDDQPPVATAQLERVLKETINQATQEELVAYSTLNPAPLRNSYVNQALQKRLQIVDVLRGNNSYANSTRQGPPRFDSISVSTDGRDAEVRLTEGWSTNFHNIYSRFCTGHWHERDVPQTVRLTYNGGRWMIYEREAHEREPQMAPCH
jgi:hypothetical protein